MKSWCQIFCNLFSVKAINAFLSCFAIHSFGTFAMVFKNNGIIEYNGFISIVSKF
jgi:hypothetical protein